MSDASKCLTGFEACGCCSGVTIVGPGPDESAWKMAADMAKSGCTVEQMTVGEWRERVKNGLFCADHQPSGPPWWKSNKKRAKHAAQAGLGL